MTRLSSIRLWCAGLIGLLAAPSVALAQADVPDTGPYSVVFATESWQMVVAQGTRWRAQGVGRISVIMLQLGGREDFAVEFRCGRDDYRFVAHSVHTAEGVEAVPEDGEWTVMTPDAALRPVSVFACGGPRPTLWASVAGPLDFRTITRRLAPQTRRPYLMTGGLEQAFVISMGSRVRHGRTAQVVVTALVPKVAARALGQSHRVDGLYEFDCEAPRRFRLVRHTSHHEALGPQQSIFRADGGEWEPVGGEVLTAVTRFACDEVEPAQGWSRGDYSGIDGLVAAYQEMAAGLDGL